MSTAAEHIPAQLPMIAPHKSEAEQAFALMLRKAKALSQSTLVPKDYQGDTGLPNVFIALEIADRTGASPLAVMQNLYVVQGKPGWSSSYLIATVNACGRFTPLRFEVVGGDDPFADTYKVRAHATDKDAGEHCVGSWITWKMVKAEGWDSKSGSKWKTMPEQMFMYRAAAFWTRAYAPELSLGIQTSDEVQDVWGGGSEPRPAQSADVRDLGERLRLRAQSVDAEVAETVAAPAQPDAPTIDPADLRRRLHLAETIDALDEAAADISLLPLGEERDEIGVIYAERKAALA